MSTPIVLPTPDLLTAFADLWAEEILRPQRPSSDWDRFDAEMRAQRERRAS